MNKIYIVNDEITKTELDQTLELETFKKNELFDVTVIKLNIFENTDIEIHFESTIPTKLELAFTINPELEVNLTEWKQGQKLKIHEQFFIYQNSHVVLTKINQIDTIKEYTEVYLKEEHASFESILKTKSHHPEKYDMIIHHEAKSTNSNLINHGVCTEHGEIIFNVSTFISHGNTGCSANQNNRIINLTDHNCSIKPNLFIDESDVTATHSAYIGTFAADQFFYLERLGIDQNHALQLLLKGFLMSHLTLTEEQLQPFLENSNL